MLIRFKQKKLFLIKLYQEDKDNFKKETDFQGRETNFSFKKKFKEAKVFLNIELADFFN